MTPAQEAAFARISPLFGEPDPAFMDQLRGALSSGRAQLWPAARAAIVSEVCDFAPEPRRVLHAWLLGDQIEAEALMPGFLAWAEVAGCTEWVARHVAPDDLGTALDWQTGGD